MEPGRTITAHSFADRHGHMIVLLLCRSVVAKRTISKVLSGNWSGAVTYSSGPRPDVDLNFTVTRDLARPTSLTTEFKGESVFINLSNKDISGNITMADRFFTFNFTEIVPPFVSSDIDLGELGLAHCVLASFVGIRCIYVNGETSLSIMFRKLSGQPGGDFQFLKRHWKALLIIVGSYLFRRFFSKYVGKSRNDMIRDAALKTCREVMEGEDKKKEEGDVKNRKTDAKEEEAKEAEPDATGKVKTD